ncbi:MAG: MoxR family ATPase [Gammaproteobacteria bacterium]|nr:MoxR family ATPase [Gammaproteobacteria bacterium]MDH3534443.1 MoxR family ATPase [Gammaproteobacteria bacterium]
MNDSTSSTSAALGALRDHINSRLVGQSAVVDQVLIALLAGGHVLIEGVPGLGKTLLVQALAAGIGGKFKRIQFTPDLMPGDVTGHVMFDMSQSKFVLKHGPVFTNLLLADEINRAPAKTQAALLEVMQEHQVTLDGKSMEVGKPFMVLATQNPIEQEGTYALPEAELDRFIIKINIDYPQAQDEVLIATRYALQSFGGEADDTHQMLDVEAAQRQCAAIEVDDRVAQYAVDLVRATRGSTLLRHGAGPRASIALLRCAKALALMNGVGFITPDDVKSMVLPVLRHRVILAPEVEIDGLGVDAVLSNLLEKVDAPRS